MLTRIQLGHCLEDSLTALNETKGLHLVVLKVDQNNTSASLDIPTYEITIGSKNHECNDFEIIANRNGCEVLYKKDYAELCKKFMKIVWENYKTHRFIKEDEELRQSLYNKLVKDWEELAKANKSSQNYTEADVKVTKETIDELNKLTSGPKWKDTYLHNDTYTMAEIDKLLEKGTVKVDLKDWTEQKW